MVTPRRSARVAAHDSSPNYNENETTLSGRKRKSTGDAAGSSPSAKRGKKNAPAKKQQTIEDVMDIDQKEEEKPAAKPEEAPAEPQKEVPKATEEKEDVVEEKVEEPKQPPKEERPSETAESAPPVPAPAASAQPTEIPKEEKAVETSKPPTQVSEPAPQVSEPALQVPEPAPQVPEPAPQVSEPAPQERPAAPTESTPAPANEPPKETKPSEAIHFGSAQPSEPAREEKLAEPEEKYADQANGPTAPTEKQTETFEKKQEDQHAQATFKMDSTEAGEPKEDMKGAVPATNGTAVEPKAREGDVPSSILEKGIIYFFFRARVNVSDPRDITDIARSYMVLRPIPHGAKLAEGPIGDAKNARLIAIPKKVLPLSGKDRFMAFVEKTMTSFTELKKDFMSASDYATKTVGTSHSPPVTPVAEGVYAITTTGRESHLAYMITIPHELGEVQKDVGIKESGSFVISAKNPKFPGPANTNIGGDPGYSDDIMQEFRDLRWMPLQPKLLDYVSTQFLLIGESSGVEKALEQMPRDEKDHNETPMEEMEKLEGEDEIRVKHLKGDDAVFSDLGISKKEYPQVPTTW